MCPLKEAVDTRDVGICIVIDGRRILDVFGHASKLVHRERDAERCGALLAVLDRSTAIEFDCNGDQYNKRHGDQEP